MDNCDSITSIPRPVRGKKKHLRRIFQLARRENESNDYVELETDQDAVQIGLGNLYIRAWHEWRLNGNLPFKGGLLDQPLLYLVHIDAFDMAYQTGKILDPENPEWNKLTSAQAALARWLLN